MTHKKKCDYCGAAFETHLSFKKYCSPRCYADAQKGKVYKASGRKKNKPNTVCIKCRKEFYLADADERVRRNFCPKCREALIRMGYLSRAGSEYIDGACDFGGIIVSRYNT